MPARDDINIEDHTQLLGYLRQLDYIKADERPAMETLRGGVSNRTVLVRRAHDIDLVLKQALRKLRVQVDWYSAPERIRREADGLAWLAHIIPGNVPQMAFLDPARHILAMSAVPQPHQNWKTLLLAGAAHIKHARAFGRLLAQIHNAVERSPGLAQQFAERRFFEELRLEPYYSYTASQVPAARAFLLELIGETRYRNHALVHGDYSPKNVLIHKGKLIVLDFEVIHFGDPAFDIGFSLTHFLSKAHHLPQHRDAFLDMAREFWRAYIDILCPAQQDIVRDYAVRHTLACCLARVAGRSPLEYLNTAQRRRQQRIVLDLLEQDIYRVPHLIREFGRKLAYHDA